MTTVTLSHTPLLKEGDLLHKNTPIKSDLGFGLAGRIQLTLQRPFVWVYGLFNPCSKATKPLESVTVETAGFTCFFKQLIEKKTANKIAKLHSKWERYHPVMIGGDVFTAGYTLFSGIQFLKPTLQSSVSVSWLSFICGEIGGLINIGVAIQEFKEAHQAFKNGDLLNGWKMVFDATFLAAIGVLMILVSLSSKLVALGAVSAFFAANPWVLPVLFFVITIPLFTEIGYRVKIILSKENLASNLGLQEIKEILKHNKPMDGESLLKDSIWSELYQQFKNNPADPHLAQKSSALIEALQADMGVEAALEALELFYLILTQADKQTLVDQIEITEKAIKKWYLAQFVRLFQQLLYIFAFVISMGALTPTAAASVLNATSSFLMALPNAVALGMDLYWPFKRNIPLVVPKVDEEDYKQFWQQRLTTVPSC